MREQHVPIDPCLSVRREQRGVELAGRQHHLLVGSVEPVPIHIHVPELVVGPDLLQLSIGRQERQLIPQPDIVDRRLIGLERGGREVLLDRKRSGGDVMEIVGLSGERNVLLEVGPLEL